MPIRACPRVGVNSHNVFKHLGDNRHVTSSWLIVRSPARGSLSDQFSVMSHDANATDMLLISYPCGGRTSVSP
jgi:hypothetical protein